MANDGGPMPMSRNPPGESPRGPVVLEGVGKEYGKFTALKALTLSVADGTSLGFLGPNGAGKSTTIKIMTNLIRPSRGRATLFGIDVQREPTRALQRVGAVIETPEFYGYLSPIETLAYAGRLRGMPRKEIEARSQAVLKEVKLSTWSDHRIQEFSKGMKQRLAIAQALLHEPDLLILDEPTSGLDPRGMAEVRDVIRSLKREGRTIFMSSHLLGEVEEVCDEIALLNHGTLIVSGSMRELSRRPGVSVLKATFLQPLSEAAWETLRGLPHVEEVNPASDGSVDVRIAGGEEVQASVLESIIRAGLRVTSFHATGSPLEHLYLEHIDESDHL